MSEIKANETSPERSARETVQPTPRKAPERRQTFTTASGQIVERLYTAEDLASVDYQRDIQDPGVFPYVRGVVAQAGGTAAWVPQQRAGAGSADEGNRLFKALLAAGSAGLEVVFDAPSLSGHDPDDATARGAVGRAGVSVASLADMERLFDGIALAELPVSLAADATAPMLLAIFLVAAEKQGANWASLRGALSQDVLTAQMTGQASALPPATSMRLLNDTLAFCAASVPAWQPITVNGDRVREAGATAVEEIAFALAAAFAYLQHAVDAGLRVDDVAPRLGVALDVQSDFFEEIAKFRAARKLWADELRARFGAVAEASCQLRLHARTSRASVTPQQPYNNVVRAALQAMAAVLGGTASLHTNALDDALQTHGDSAATIAVRTQQIIAHESGVTQAADPLGGAYFVEALTQQIESGVRACWATLEQQGGLAAAIAAGHPQRSIGDAAAVRRQAIDQRQQIIVGVNDFVQDEPAAPVADQHVVEAAQVERLAALRASRNDGAVRRALASLRQTARDGGNTMPALLDCARVYVSLGEMCAALGDSVEAGL